MKFHRNKHSDGHSVYSLSKGGVFYAHIVKSSGYWIVESRYFNNTFTRLLKDAKDYALEMSSRVVA